MCTQAAKSFDDRMRRSSSGPIRNDVKKEGSSKFKMCGYVCMYVCRYVVGFSRFGTHPAQVLYLMYGAWSGLTMSQAVVRR